MEEDINTRKSQNVRFWACEQKNKFSMASIKVLRQTTS